MPPDWRYITDAVITAPAHRVNRKPGTVDDDGGENDLLDRIAADPAFGIDREALAALANPADYTGRAADQVEEFLAAEVDPVLARYPDDEAVDSEPKV